jgi:hypothetical protein
MNYTLSTLKTYIYAWVVGLINHTQSTSKHVSINFIINPTMNTKTIKTKRFSKSKTSTTTLYSNYDSLQRKVVFLKVTNTPLYTNQKETSQETS